MLAKPESGRDISQASYSRLNEKVAGLAGRSLHGKTIPHAMFDNELLSKQIGVDLLLPSLRRFHPLLQSKLSILVFVLIFVSFYTLRSFDQSSLDVLEASVTVVFGVCVLCVSWFLRST